MVKEGQTGRRLAAGKARRGGAVRNSCSGDQIDGGARLRDAGDVPHRVVVVVGLGVAGKGASNDLGGCQSLGELGLVARRRGKARGVVR